MSCNVAEEWRLNVAAVVVDAIGNVLLGSNPEESRHRHFPQGGVEPGESFAAAVMRELWEETGLGADSCRIVARFGGLRYRYRADNPKSGRWKGQEQCYFLICCSAVRPPVAARRGHEFSCFEWVHHQRLEISVFAPVKRKAVATALTAFFPQDVEWSPEAVAARLGPERYRLQVSHPPLRLHDPGERALFGGGKEEALSEAADLAAEFQRLRAQKNARCVLLLFGTEGCGMRGCLRHLAAGMDPLSTQIGAPRFDRPAPDFLWPLHAALPSAGDTLLLPHSPYDELLQMPQKDRERSAAHLADFETMLSEEGVCLVKAFLHISEKKFLEKQTDGMELPARTAAIESWRNRTDAAASLLQATHLSPVPWYIIPSDHRRYRDIVLWRLLMERLSATA